MQTRAEYRQSMTDCNSLNTLETKTRRELVYHNYYLQFSSHKLERLVLYAFDLKQLKKAYVVDKNLNNLSLKLWYNLFSQFRHLIDRDLIKSTGERLSVSTCVCILKNIAIDLIKRNKYLT